MAETEAPPVGDDEHPGDGRSGDDAERTGDASTDEGDASDGGSHRSTKRGKHEQGRPRRFIGSTPFLILVALGVALLVKTFFVQAFYIPSESMVPTLAVGDRVFVNKIEYDLGGIERGDVIVFENPHRVAGDDPGPIGGFLQWLGEGIGFAQGGDEDIIKRVVGLPGETVEIRNDVVYINGQRLDEPYLTEDAEQQNGDYPITQVPQGSLFVLGDNRGNSADSRWGLGMVPVDKVVGKAFVIIWPPADWGRI